jgi:hypothetical protein
MLSSNSSCRHPIALVVIQFPLSSSNSPVVILSAAKNPCIGLCFCFLPSVFARHSERRHSQPHRVGRSRRTPRNFTRHNLTPFFNRKTSAKSFAQSCPNEPGGPSFAVSSRRVGYRTRAQSNGSPHHLPPLDNLEKLLYL